MNKARIVIAAIIAVPILGFLTIWGGSVIHSAILTHRVGYIFETAIAENPQVQNRVGAEGNLNVLSYSGTYARVYREWANQEGTIVGGAVFLFSKTDNIWQVTGQLATWSDTGNASDIIWPFFYRSVEGRIAFLFIFILTTILMLKSIGLYLLISRRKQLSYELH
ncbi:MAG: hypothetical protein FWC89_06820 [Defluviitaleaceae bacterium]|nr:hypothetical protein [Defluviitaleaceae bacterium]